MMRFKLIQGDYYYVCSRMKICIQHRVQHSTESATTQTSTTNLPFNAQIKNDKTKSQRQLVYLSYIVSPCTGLCEQSQFVRTSYLLMCYAL